MKQLNRFQSILFAIGGMLMVIGAGCFAFMWQQQVVCWLFLAGASMFTLMQSMQTYEGSNFVIRRLKRIQAVANIFFMLAGILMVDTAYMFFRPLFNSSIAYIDFLYNKWVVLLLIAAFLEIYSMHRIDSEMKKDKSQ
ncbi:hypothetical protein [Hoylesella loescheii]|jgi:hypothetical protein|uniref:Lipoprotein n=1 Tax=Hoylesella loescheii DSM 19665 = JCM 12249 = ATCC 15930 TaxID=1122985 RepID=A0A069QGD9_HOYLO|nr:MULTISPECIES: hypothetical protein [Prevotellaceae]KDR51860.1 hypothetical protein HMPREF1991_02071 [Hoylesella loescheii DSM 19665 = JCM 12249 = ATCC 15930]RKW57723.1 MAG: hypothetical protein D8H98_12460 [Prevotella sp.]